MKVKNLINIWLRCVQNVQNEFVLEGDGRSKIRGANRPKINITKKCLARPMKLSNP